MNLDVLQRMAFHIIVDDDGEADAAGVASAMLNAAFEIECGAREIDCDVYIDRVVIDQKVGIVADVAAPHSLRAAAEAAYQAALIRVEEALDVLAKPKGQMPEVELDASEIAHEIIEEIKKRDGWEIVDSSLAQTGSWYLTVSVPTKMSAYKHRGIRHVDVHEGESFTVRVSDHDGCYGGYHVNCAPMGENPTQGCEWKGTSKSTAQNVIRVLEEMSRSRVS